MLKILFTLHVFFCFTTISFGQSWETLSKEGLELYDTGKYKESYAVLEKAKTKAEEEFGKNHVNYATACNDLGMLSNKLGQISQAETLYLEAKNLREKLLSKKHIDYATSCNSLALLYKNQGLFSASELLYVEAKNIIEQILGKEQPEYGIACVNLGVIYFEQGLYSKTEPLYKEGINIIEKKLGKEHVMYMTFCGNLAELYRANNAYAKAEILMTEVRDITKKKLGAEHPNYAIACSSLGTLYIQQKLYDKAMPLITEAKSILEKKLGKEHQTYLIVCSNLAQLYKEMDNLQEAEMLMTDVKNTREKVLGKDSDGYATSCSSLASFYADKKEYQKAENLMIESKNIFEKLVGKNHTKYATITHNLGYNYFQQAKFEPAEKLTLEAKNIREKILGKNHIDFISSCALLIDIYKAQKKSNLSEIENLFLDINKAIFYQINYNFFSLSEKEKSKFYHIFFKKSQIFYDFSAKYYPQNPQIASEAYNNTISTKAFLFNTINKMRERIINSKDTALQNLYSKWRDKKEYFAKAYTLNQKEKEKRQINMSSLENDINNIEKKLAQKSEFFAQANDKIQYVWTDVQKKLNENEASIEIVRFRTYNTKFTDSVKYMALIITPKSKFPEMVLMENGNDLEEKYLLNYKNAIKEKKEDVKSYMQYWDKIAKALPKNTTKIYLSNDGLYHQINVLTLWNPTTKKYVLQELEVQLLTNTKDLLKEKTKKMHIKNAVLFGNPDFQESIESKNLPKKLEEKSQKIDQERNFDFIDWQIEKKQKQPFFDKDSIKNLPHTEEEVKNLDKILKTKNINTTIFLKKEATKNNLKNTKFPDILHIATHGFFLTDTKNKNINVDDKKITENPLFRSGLLFSQAKNSLEDKTNGEGILTAFEAMNLDLDNTQLVVLSACETGLGEIKNGEGVYGLQRAFQSAGAKTVLMSLWNVSDQKTSDFMYLFYENWLTKGQTKTNAFRNAQLFMVKNKENTPFHWGGFVMTGLE